MAIFKTKKEEELKVTSNQQKRHFTIKIGGVKYRTFPMNKEEFQNAEFWMEGDWKDFLRRNNGEYYKKKK